MKQVPTETGGERLFPSLAVALFESPMDAREALEALARLGCDPGRIALAVRDQEADAGEQTERHNAVAEAVDSARLAPLPVRPADMVLAVLPERGTYLIAGAISRALSGSQTGNQAGDGALTGSPLQVAFVRLGFTLDEALYLDDRLFAGALLAAVVGDQPGQLGPVREAFADHDAVHIGAARIEDAQLVKTGLLGSLVPGTRLAGETLIIDVVSPVARLCDLEDVPAEARAICGTSLQTTSGESYGQVIDLFGELADGDASRHYRPTYAVVENSGMLGFGRRHVLVPAQLLEAAGDGAVRLPVAQDVIDNAPSFNPAFPLSRREEALVSAYFGTVSTWEVEHGSAEG